ncbi:hypothetical protein ACIQ2D_09185 [Lysinibacillus sp. NPDC097287]|uniref:hypothetical protein n=1 Tax=Lysinibacillus sp. NPDC097287 TaxID=3364144 RepID=UPI0037FD3DEF
MKKVMYSVCGVFIVGIISFGIFQYTSHFPSRETAIENYVVNNIPYASAQLVDIAETDTTDIYYLLLRTNGSDIINTTSSVRIVETVFGWKVTDSPIGANVNLAKYLIDPETGKLK